MKKVFFSLLIFADIIGIGACTYYLYQRLTNAPSTPAVPLAKELVNVSTSTLVTSSTTTGSVVASSSPASSPNYSGPLANVLFSYFNKKAGRVSIVADFTDGKPVALTQDPKGFWKYQSRLVPEKEYVYYYSVDGKKMKDPLNKKKKLYHNFEASVIVPKKPQPKPLDKSVSSKTKQK